MGGAVSQEIAEVERGKIKYEKDAPLTPEELEELRLTVGWPPLGVYDQILAEGLFYLSARLDGALVGFLHVTGSPHGDVLIHDFCVRPDLQGKGVGYRLMERALDVCRQMKPQGINILFEERNRPFFEQFGFKIMCGGYMNAPMLAGKPQTGEEGKG
jgi:GNAT superfamily N-acetyltransferase